MDPDSDGGTLAGSGSEKLYEVEYILKKRVKPGNKLEYFLKWKGWGEEHNSWEPAENLVCPEEVLASFEKWWAEEEEKTRKMKNARKRAAKKNKTSGPVGPSTSKQSKVLSSTLSGLSLAEGGGMGFERGLEPEKIVGVTRSTGEITLLIKWKGVDLADLVPLSEARVRCPQLVIDFFVERLVFHNED